MPQLSSNNIPINTRNTRGFQAAYPSPPQRRDVPDRMSDGMRNALLKICGIACLCVAGLAIFGSPSPTSRPRVAEIERNERPPQPTVVPAVFRTTVSEAPRQVTQPVIPVARPVEPQRLTASRSEETPIRPTIAAPTKTAFQLDPNNGFRAATPAPMRVESPWIRYRLIPGMNLNINTYGRPCTVRTDATIEVFPNNPSLPHRIVQAGSGLHFPILRGEGPNSIHARPVGRSGGTLELRFDH